jgi:hypothetical protein
MAPRWVMGELARRDQYALPITGGLEQQALARMPAISMNVEDRRPTGPHSFQAQEPVIVQDTQQQPRSWSDVMEQAMMDQRSARDMTFGQPDKYGFSQSLDESLQGSGTMPHPLQATPVDKFTDHLTQQAIFDDVNRAIDTQERQRIPGVPTADEWRHMREQYDADPNAYDDPETGTN